MDYEAIDREMSCWLVSCVHKGVKLYLQDGGLGTDIEKCGCKLNLATRYRWKDQAEAAASKARADKAWRGFDWKAIMRAGE